MTTTTNYFWFTPEELEAIAEELELEHEDYRRLALYVFHVFSYDQRTHTKESAIREQLEKIIAWEEEGYLGHFETTAEFAQEVAENYLTEVNIPDWVVVDWQATWDRNLRHDYFEEEGFVWSNIY